jgi:twitching motility protein PilT
MTGQMHEVIKEGEYYGMQTFDQHLLKHLQAGRITYEEAMKTATSPHDFKLLVQADQRLRHLASVNETAEQEAPAPAPVAPPPVVADVVPPPAPAPAPAAAPAPVAPQSVSAPPPGF